MGMFDTIRTKMPLPGITLPDFVEPGFQTKDLHCNLDDYTLTEEGTLKLDGELVPYTGEVNMYTCNSSIWSGGSTYTRGGVDEVWVEYKLLFAEGRLIYINQTKYEQKPAKDADNFWQERAKEAK